MLKRLAAELLQQAVEQFEKTGKKQRLLTCLEYQANPSRIVEVGLINTSGTE